MTVIMLSAAVTGWGTSGGSIIGQAVLLTVAAVVLGYIVARVWPKDFNPGLFGFLTAASLLGGLAAFGMPAAILAVVLVLVLSTLLFFAGVM